MRVSACPGCGLVLSEMDGPTHEPPRPNGTLTVEHPLADGPENHAARVREWAEDVWRARTPHHPKVNAWLCSYL